MLLRAEDHGSPDFPPVHFPCEKQTGDHPTHPLMRLYDDAGGATIATGSHDSLASSLYSGDSARILGCRLAEKVGCDEGTAACFRVHYYVRADRIHALEPSAESVDLDADTGGLPDGGGLPALAVGARSTRCFIYGEA